MQWRWVASVGSSFSLALLLVVPAIEQRLWFWLLGYPARFVNTMFHELGHAVVAWILGYPAIPSILTVFGSEKAAGVSLTFDHRWPVQIFVWGLMVYGCWWLHRERQQHLAWIAAGVTIIFIALGFWPYNKLLIAYMGHGSSIFVGGVFLYRGLLYLESRNEIERWLHLFFGWSLLLKNFVFAWQLAYDPFMRSEYTNFNVGGNSSDFSRMQEIWPILSVPQIAKWTLVYILVVILITGCLAYIRRHDYEDYS